MLEKKPTLEPLSNGASMSRFLGEAVIGLWSSKIDNQLLYALLTNSQSGSIEHCSKMPHVDALEYQFASVHYM